MMRSHQKFNFSSVRFRFFCGNFMKSCGLFLLSIFFLTAMTAFSQNPRTAISPVRNLVEPFQISRGKSFNITPASAPRAEPGVGSRSSDTQKIEDDYAEAVQLIQKNYLGGKKADLNKLTKNSISAMLRTLDPHSHYFDTTEYEDLLTDQQSEYFGIGATIVNYESNGEINTYVVSTYPDSAAARAGLRFGDKIIAVGGVNVAGEDSADVRDKVRGKLGTTARLTIERAETKKTEIIEIKRSRIPQPSLPDAYILKNGVGYIDLTNGFNYTTAEELTAALKELHRQNVTSLILDLRDNPGGIVDQAVKVAEKFIPEGSTVVSQRGRLRGDNIVWRSVEKSPETLPLVILVNENTASASEIVSGALQDYDRALIVGQRTFGKGLVQSIINLPYGSGLTLTTAKYFTPSGRSIQRDYSNIDFYDYYNRKLSLSEFDKTKAQSFTLTGRKVYGGDGIAPDEAIKADNLTAAEATLLDPLFFFSVELANGRVKNFERLRTAPNGSYGQRIAAGEFAISDELLAEFGKFLNRGKYHQSIGEAAAAQSNFIKNRLRLNLATAAYGSISANQVIIENDSQVARAVGALPRAGELAQNARKFRTAKK